MVDRPIYCQTCGLVVDTLSKIKVIVEEDGAGDWWYNVEIAPKGLKVWHPGCLPGRETKEIHWEITSHYHS